MPKRYGYSFTLAGLMALTVGLAFQADAGLLVFTSRDAWQSALGGGGLQYNFSAFAGMSFVDSAINFGPFSLRTPIALGLPAGSNMVIGPPFDELNNPSVDGTAYASMFLDSTHSVVMDFSQPMRAFGGDFSGGNTMNFGIFTGGRSALQFVDVPAVRGPFLGLISTDPFDGIVFGNEGSPGNFGLDNVSVSSGVPEPSSLMILGMGATLFAAYSCWSLRRGKN